MGGERIRLHFQNAETDGHSPLGSECVSRRLTELTTLFEFLDRYGAIKENMTRQFLERLERESSVDSLDQCFPFHALSVNASVQDFYDFYEI